MIAVKVRSKWRPTAIIYLTTRAVIAEQRARKTCFRKNVAEDDVSTGHSPRMRLAREAIAKRYFADENKLDDMNFTCAFELVPVCSYDGNDDGNHDVCVYVCTVCMYV